MYNFLYYQRLNKKLIYNNFLQKKSFFLFNFYSLSPIDIELFKTICNQFNFMFLKCDFSFFKNLKNFQFFNRTKIKNLLISENLYMIFPNVKSKNLIDNLISIFNQNKNLYNSYCIGFLNYNLIIDKKILFLLLNYKYTNKINTFFYFKINTFFFY